LAELAYCLMWTHGNSSSVLSMTCLYTDAIRQRPRASRNWAVCCVISFLLGTCRLSRSLDGSTFQFLPYQSASQTQGSLRVTAGQRRSTVLRSAASDEMGDKAFDMPGDSDMAELQNRLNEARTKPELPFLVIDSMCPGQRLEFTSKDLSLEQLMENGDVAVVGMASSGAVYRFGVTGKLRLIGPFKWELRAGRHFKIASAGQRDENGVTRAQVEFVEDVVEDTDKESAQLLGLLVQEWRELVEGSKFERFDGQIQQILRDLGPMPPAEEAGKRALWVAALVNPLPALGVAYEIRPAALSAVSVGERLEVVTQGIKCSIGHVSGSQPLF